MPRALKFRAWDKDRKVMYAVHELRWTQSPAGHDVLIAEPGLDHMDIQDAQWATKVVGKSIEVMQFTGLQDSKGKDIYEGDILRFAAYNAVGVVFWDNKYFGCWVELHNRPDDERQNGSLFDFSTSVGWGDSYEVCGNVYETPDILTLGAS